MSNNNSYIQWTDEEWAAVAESASRLKTAKPELSWMNVAVVSQDGISPERRRFYFNKLSALKPMFDILGLTEEGTEKPPPPPPEPPVAEPAISAADIVSDKFGDTALFMSHLRDIPAKLLIAELLNRGQVLKDEADRITQIETSTKVLIADHNQRLDSVLQRIDDVEGLVLKSLEESEKINTTYTSLLAESESIQERLDSAGFPKTPVSEGLTRPQQGIANMQATKIKFLLIGPHTKDLARIYERLPRSSSVELIYGENDDKVKMPASVHYCLVSGHNDYSRRWQTALATYGPEKAVRMENGALATFAHHVEQIYIRHTRATADLKPSNS